VHEYSGSGSDILLVEVEGMGHAWAGGKAEEKYFDPKGFSATELTTRYLILGEQPFK
jgi:hypothetical protein